ncbi:MAG: LPP20 family lipoprotein [Myxococcales bacterium]|nr:LPP20 family lipoprotein [Myxococcales bacterium]
MRSACLAVLISCAGAHPPAWTDAALHRDYEDAKYVRAVGVGQSPDPVKARRLADLNAFAGVAEQIRVLVTSENQSVESSDNGGEQTFVADVVQSFARESLSALRVVERYADGDTAWSLAALDRGVALAELSRRMTEARLAGGQARAARDEALARGRARTAFAALREEYVAAVRSVELARTASALQRDGTRLEPQSPAAVLGEARKILDRIQLRKLAGEQQELIPGSAARAPLEVQARIDDVPLSGLSLRSVAAVGALDVETPPATDSAGRSSFRIPLVGRDPAGSYAVTVRADLSALRDGKDAAWDDVFAGEPAVVFSFGRTSRRALRIELHAAGEILALLKEQLAGQGYTIVDGDPDVVVEGEAKAASNGSTPIGQSARCSGELRVLREGQLVNRIPITASAVGPTLDEALTRALRAGAREAAEKLGTRY